MAQKRVVKKKVLKKKAASAPTGLPGTRPGVPGRPKPPVPDGEGFSVGALVMLLVAIALLAGVVVLFLPPDLSGLAGRPFDPSKAPDPPRNLLRELDDAITATYVESKPSSLTFTEEEVNLYLNQRLRRVQKGPFASLVKMEGIYLDLHPDYADIVLVRHLLGMPFVVKTRWDYFLSNGQYTLECKASGVGLLSFSGALFRPILMPFERLGRACGREIAALDDGAVERVKLEEGKMVVQVR
jgi:hypothetical protein